MISMKKIIYRIQEIGEICGGGTPRTTISEYWDGDIPWISPDDLTDYKSVYIKNGKNFITKLGYKNSSTKMLPKGTLLFSSRAPIGYIAIAENPICTNQGFKSIILNDKVNNLYFYYWLKCNLNYIKLFGTGATFPEISGSRMKRIKVEIFENIEYQQKIAMILGKYDQLIENNNKRIKLLEQMAEGLYKEWFVRFRFPGYEKTCFVDGIPEGWKYKKFSKCFNTSRGISYSSEEIECEYGMNLINLKNIQSYGGFRRDGTKKYSGKYKKDQTVKYKDLIMGVTDMTQDRRTVGHVALVPNIEGVISADLIKLDSDINNLFWYCLFRYGFYSKMFSQFGNGANVIHLKPQSIKNQKILVPTLELIEKFVKKVELIIDEIEILNAKNELLAEQRDLLLPRLMSGKIDLED